MSRYPDVEVEITITARVSVMVKAAWDTKTGKAVVHGMSVPHTLHTEVSQLTPAELADIDAQVRAATPGVV